MDIRLQLITQQQIIFNGIKIYQPSLSEIIKIGIEEYNYQLLPFIVDIETLNLPIQASEMSIFDILTLENNLPILLTAIKQFCRLSEMKFDESLKRLYIDNGYLDRKNFKEFSDIILKINSKERPKIEKTPNFTSNKQKEIWDKIQKGRKRKESTNQLYLFDMINVCEFGGEYHIPMSEIMTWSLWRISNCYKTILSKSGYKDSFNIFLVSGEKELIENKHWLEQIKIS